MDVTDHAERGEGTGAVALQRHPPGIVGDFFDALADTAARICWRVRRLDPAARAAPDEVAVVWNGRRYLPTGPTLYCEHGWLPRWDYQVSPAGINADSHVAPFVWDGTPPAGDDVARLERHLEAIRTSGPERYAYMQTAAPAVHDLPAEFLLVPLQMEWDTNVQRHAPVRYRRMQALVDDVLAAEPPWPVIFKQHPADVRRGNMHLRLRVGSGQGSVRAHHDGNVHQLLKSGRCRGIVSLNSNVVHDGLLWNVPAVVLGDSVWPRTGPSPFLDSLPADWRALPDQLSAPRAVACRHAYALYLMRNQWSLADMKDPMRVQELLRTLPWCAGVVRTRAGRRG